MLRRRPDIRRAERSIAANNTLIGQRVADLLPSVSLFGTVGYSSSQASNLFSGANVTSILAPMISWNFLNYPRTHARINEAMADRDTAIATYQGVVLAALQDANTALSRLGRQRQNVDKLATAEAAANRAATLARQRYAGGRASLIDQLDAERQHVQTQESLAQARATLSTDYVALQAALGLGWSI